MFFPKYRQIVTSIWTKKYEVGGAEGTGAYTPYTNEKVSLTETWLSQFSPLKISKP